MQSMISGIQTSGSLHLGNYLGSIKNWLKLQNQYHSLFFLADLHSITEKCEPITIRKSSMEIAAIYIAAGIDYNQSILFKQSAVSAHAELAFILSCMTSMGLMNRMTQFKDKAGENKEKASLGLYSYPVLMAADILLYNVDLVPVGDDQKQHLELTRNIAENFNRKLGVDFFNIPEPYIVGETTRVMSLKNGLDKMSKSNSSDLSRINMLDDQDIIAKKIKKAKTDSVSTIYYDKENRPEVSNLLSILAALQDKAVVDIIQDYKYSNISKLKQDLTEAIIDKIVPIANEVKKLLADEQHIIEILEQGSKKAKLMADKNYNKIKEMIGFS